MTAEWVFGGGFRTSLGSAGRVAFKRRGCWVVECEGLECSTWDESGGGGSVSIVTLFEGFTYRLVALVLLCECLY